MKNKSKNRALNAHVAEKKPSMLLSSWRRRRSEALNASTRTLLEEAHSDRGRVIFSASFRRLSQKTQVFALSMDGARTRLTHSLEVAHVGTYIVDEVFKKLDALEKKSDDGDININSWKEIRWEERLAIRSFVEVSCLVHDIGNPPFGHFGERAICNWFDLHKTSTWFKNSITKQDLSYDFLGFDGNKQGFRILTRLQRNSDDEFGLNLTATQLASTIKYPSLSAEKPTKCSFFQSEADIKNDIWENLGLKSAERHPLSLIMEAADDIAYCVSDLEDAAEKNIVSEQDLIRAFGQGINFSPLSKGITKARTNLTNSLVQFVADQFINRIRDGRLCASDPLLEGKDELKNLRDVTSERVYSSRIVLSNEITGYKVIQGLLDSFVPLLKMPADNFRKLALAFENRKTIYTDDLSHTLKLCTQEPSLVSLFPRKHLAIYREAATTEKEPELFHRIHLIIDFVAGMTDDFALNTYRLLSGQTIYGQER